MCSAADTLELQPLASSITQPCGYEACIRSLRGLQFLTLEIIVSNTGISTSQQISHLTLDTCTWYLEAPKDPAACLKVYTTELIRFHKSKSLVQLLQALTQL